MLKLTILSLVIISSSAFASLTASEALLKTINPGLYNGKTDLNTECQVIVKILPGFYQTVTQVTAIDDQSEVTYNINNSHSYSVGRVGRQNVRFLQNEIQNDSIIGSLKIVNADDNLLNISVGSYSAEGNESEFKEVSCNI